MKLSVIIPVYNEKSTIREVLRKVREVDIDKEIIVVDDGSTDGTTDILEGEKDDIVKVHTSKVNFGKGAAVRIGCKYAKGDVVIIQDADLELDPNEYTQLIEPIIEGKSKVVYGSRFLRKQNLFPPINWLANKFLVLMTNILYGSNLTDMETAYKVFRREILVGLDLECLGFDFEPEVTAKLLKKGIKIYEIPIAYHPRTIYEGKKINWKDGVHAIWTLVKYRILR